MFSQCQIQLKLIFYFSKYSFSSGTASKDRLLSVKCSVNPLFKPIQPDNLTSKLEDIPAIRPVAFGRPLLCSLILWCATRNKCIGKTVQVGCTDSELRIKNVISRHKNLSCPRPLLSFQPQTALCQIRVLQ